MRLGIDSALSKRLVARRLDKFRELRVRHLVPVDPETIDLDDWLKRSSGRCRSEPMTKLPPLTKTMPALLPSSCGSPE